MSSERSQTRPASSKTLAELVAQVGVAAAEHQRRRPGHRLLGVRRSAERGDRASTDPLGDVFGRQRRHRRDHPLAQQQDRGALADAIADRADGLREGGRRNRQADQVDAGQLDVRRPLDGERVGELDPGQVLLVGPGVIHLLRPLRGARPELDIEPATGEQHRHGRAPASSPDHRRLAQRRQPAQPLPLQLDHRPDAGADRVGERRGGSSVRGKVSARPARTLTFRGRIVQPRRTCSVPWTATGSTAAPVSRARRPKPRFGPAQRAGPDAGPLREDADGAAALQHVPRGDQGLLVRLAAAHGIGAEPVQDPALPAAARRARPSRRSAAAGARGARRRSRRGRGSCGGWRRRSAAP